jgi:HAMP domain-containing protein
MAVTQVILKPKRILIERMVAMLRLIRRHREINRARRELNRAIANASTPAMRDELILVAQRGGNVF